jgi:hypothetical protein
MCRFLIVACPVVVILVYWQCATFVSPQNAKQSKAVLGCKGLALACEAYFMNPKSSGKWPRTLDDLVAPSFGGSFLKNGQQDLMDPWGKPYTYALLTFPDGGQVPFISTTSPDGVVISQYGIGSQALPPQR